MAMSLLPAELPLILTIFLGLGAWRIAQKQVLTRQISAIEMLGAASVLCVDKTGTLTINRMAVTELIANGEVFKCEQLPENSAKEQITSSDNPPTTQLPEQFHETVEFAMLAKSLQRY